MSAILSYPDRTLSSTLSGGSWNASYPLNNLKLAELTTVARSANTLATSTVIKSDQGLIVSADGLSVAPQVTRCLSLMNHNCSFDATIRVRGYSDSGYTSYVAGTDTGVVNLWPQSLAPAEYLKAPCNWTYCYPAGVQARYWLVEIVDVNNPAGYVEAGRLWIGPAFQPAVGISFGSSLGYESRDLVTETLGGTYKGETKQARRSTAVQFDYLTAADTRQALYAQKTLTGAVELLWVANSAAAPEDMIHEAFPALMRKADQLSYPYFNNHELPLEIVEILGNDRIKTIPTVITLDARLTSDLNLLIGTGPATFTRASKAYQPDFENRFVPVMENCPSFPGMRAVTNLLTYSAQPSLGLSASAASVAGNTISNTGGLGVHYVLTNSYPSDKEYIFSVRAKAGSVTHIALRENGVTGAGAVFNLLTGTVHTSFGVDASIKNEGDGSFTCSILHGANPGAVYYFAALSVPSTVTFMDWAQFSYSANGAYYTLMNFQLENVTGQSNKNPSEYVPTTSAPITKWFDYYNPYTVDGNGVVTDGGLRIPIDGSSLGFTLHAKGYLSEPASTNKCLCYGVPRADALGTEIITVAADRDFTSDTGYWTKQTGVTIAGGAVVFTNAVSQTGFYKLMTTLGKKYSVTYTVLTCAQGGFIAGNGGPNGGTVRNAPGTYTDVVGPLTTAGIGIFASGITSGTIGDISIKEAIDAVGTKSYWTGAAYQQNIAGMTLGGETAAVLSIVTKQAEIDAAGLGQLTASGKVYKLDNTAGPVKAYVLAGSTGNLNPHSTSAYYMTTGGEFGFSTSVSLMTNSATFQLVKKENYTPTDTGNTWYINALPGQITYFILPQLEEKPVATSIIPTQGATATRAITSLTLPVVGNMVAAQGTLIFTYEALGAAGYPIQGPFSWYDDCASSAQLFDGATPIFTIVGVILMEQRVALGIAWSLNGVKLFVNGVLRGTTPTPLTANFVGNITFSGINSNSRNLRIYNRALSDAQIIAMTSQGG